MIICLGGVCIPIHLLLAFLVAWAHRHGYLLFLREEWFTFRYWREKMRGVVSRGSSRMVQQSEKSQ